jgi:hypothetical protein
VAAAWVLAQASVTGAICGARAADQVDGWIAASDIELTDHDFADLRSGWGPPGLEGGRVDEKLTEWPLTCCGYYPSYLSAWVLDEKGHVVAGQRVLRTPHRPNRPTDRRTVWCLRASWTEASGHRSQASRFLRLAVAARIQRQVTQQLAVDGGFVQRSKEPESIIAA